MKMTLRALHRWLGLVSAVLFMGIAVTALGLQVDLWLTGKPPPGAVKKGAPPPPPIPSEALVAKYAKNAVIAAQSDDTLTNAKTLTINFGPKPTANFERKGKKIDVTTGQFLPPPPKKIDWHYVLQDIHAGYFLGTFGRIISCFLAISLFIISYTGLTVYLDMFRRRRKLGRKGLFWK